MHRGNDSGDRRLAGVWIEGEPRELRLVGTLGYWPEDWADVERAQVFTVGSGPEGAAAKTLWSFLAPDLKGDGGSQKNGAPFYSSSLDLPDAGCWRLTLTTDDLEATVDIRAVD